MMTNVTVDDVGEIIARLKVFTEHMSVFNEEDNLTVSAAYMASEQTIFVLISSTAFSLLYRVMMTNTKKVNMALTFEQIITIKSANSLHIVNKKQLCAVSNTSIIIFQRDPTECNDMRNYFIPEKCTENQCKRLVG
jgi:hypothetical protein